MSEIFSWWFKAFDKLGFRIFKTKITLESGFIFIFHTKSCFYLGILESVLLGTCKQVLFWAFLRTNSSARGALWGSVITLNQRAQKARVCLRMSFTLNASIINVKCVNQYISLEFNYSHFQLFKASWTLCEILPLPLPPANFFISKREGGGIAFESKCTAVGYCDKAPKNLHNCC